MNVAGVIKDGLLIAFSRSIIRDTINPVNLFLYDVTFLGVSYYNKGPRGLFSHHIHPSLGFLWISDYWINKENCMALFCKAADCLKNRQFVAPKPSVHCIPDLFSFMDISRNSSCEGIMVKTLDDLGILHQNVVKRDYVEGIGDSLDLVLISAWHGNGRKVGCPFLVACYNPDTEEFQSVCRIMSGFSDSFYLEGNGWLIKNRTKTEIEAADIEYYFSVDDLCKDIFLRGKMDDQGWVPVSLIATFNMVKRVTTSIAVILNVLRDSTELEIQEIRRREDWMRWLLPSMENPNGHGSTPHLTLNHDDSVIHPMQTLGLEEYSSQATMSCTQTEVALDRGSTSCSCNCQQGRDPAQLEELYHSGSNHEIGSD
ncbi:hypothetical protein ZIOFF_003720 [Zingiber officinale]|uniref:HTH La-type RNA-binding domain-containing protein n=1 Tax=Zingiber officinale TaxID=94328 RepID=A0A8J5I6V7_ZINOF|nr:hypothetical protein ZIOFF_003720 [Zingiber officinale]